LHPTHGQTLGCALSTQEQDTHDFTGKYPPLCSTRANPPRNTIKRICNGNKKSRPKAAFLYSSIDGWHIASLQYQKL